MVDQLVESLLENYEVLARQPDVWGLLLKANTSKRQLRKAFLQATKINAERRWPGGTEFHAFRLNLPEEAALLPILMGSLCAIYGVDNRELWFTDDSVDLRSLPKKIAEIADFAELESITRAPSLGIDIRAAALFMSLLHPRTQKTLHEAEDLIVAFYSKDLGPWYFTAVMVAISLLTSDETSEASSLIARVLDVARQDYSGRKQLDYIINRWRQNSYAPVQKAGVQKLWLTTS